MKKVLIVGVLLGLALSLGAPAYAVPFMDTGFAGVTSGPDLVVAREQYKWIAAENTWRHHQ